MQLHEPLKANLKGAVDMVVSSWWQLKAITIGRRFQKAGFVRNAEAFEACEERHFVDETGNTNNVQSGLVDSNIVSTTDTFEDYVDAGENELVVCEEASTDDAVGIAVCSSPKLATEDGADDDEDEDCATDVPCKQALECLNKVKMYSV